MTQAAVLRYDGSFEGFLCCVFTAYEENLRVQEILAPGENQVALFFDEVEVVTQHHKARRVWKALEKKCSATGLGEIKWAFLSELPDIEMNLLGMITYIFAEKASVDRDFSHPAVLKVAKTARKVGREKHRMEAFVRFRRTKNDIYFAALEPDFNVLPLIKPHFKSRFADQRWIIYDLKRNFGIAYNLSEVSYMTLDLDPAIGISGASEEFFHADEIAFQTLWAQYFSSTNIKSRANAKLHTQHLPKRYWKYLPEKSVGADLKSAPTRLKSAPTRT